MDSRASTDDGRVVARPDEQLLVLQGDVDLSVVEAFDRRRDDLAWVRTIDVSRVTFVDTQGLGLMLRVAAPREREAPSARPVLLGASPQVQQLLQMLGVETLFELRRAPVGVGRPAPDGALDGVTVHRGAADRDGASPQSPDVASAQQLDGVAVHHGAPPQDGAGPA